MHPLRFALAFVSLTAVAFAQPLALSFAASDHALAAGVENKIDLVILNRGDAPQTFTAPASVTAQLTVGARSWPVELRATPSLNRAVGPGRFATQSFTFVVPAGVAGTAIIEAQLPDATGIARGVIDITEAVPTSVTTAAPATAPDAPHPPVEKPMTNLVRAEPAATRIQRTFANRLSPHEPIYFIYGADAPAAKFQFSFKYRLLNFTEISRENMSRTLQFAFTQRSLWDLAANSSPFYDTSYMPELIFESLAPKPEEKDTWLTWLGYQAGFKHESNGRDGPISRSLNTVYLRAAMAFGDLDGWHLLVVPEAWDYVTPLDDNPELKDYRGYGQLRLVFGRNDSLSLLATLWAGRHFDHGSVQLDLTLPVRTKVLDFETYLLVQYFNGYGESLLNYRDRSETIRAGVSLVR